jgi:hypothetical protein
MVLSWLFWGFGVLFCSTGLYLFYRNVYEVNKSILAPILLLIGGIILLSLGTAVFLNFF